MNAFLKMALLVRTPCLVALLMMLVPGNARAQSVPAAAPPALSLKVTTDRKDAMYRPGETVTFLIEARQGKQPVEEGTVSCVLSEDGWHRESPRQVSLKEGRATVSATRKSPGFLQLRVTSGKAAALAGAGFDPLELKPSLPVPDDFEQFWAHQKSERAKVLMSPELTAVKAPVEGVEAFDVEIKCLGNPVTGYFGRPLNAARKSLPAILFVHGAGVRSSVLQQTAWAVKEGGMLVMDINAHGILNGQPAAFYEDLKQGKLSDYRTAGRTSREDIYFKGMFLRLMRALEFLTSQPEWDGKTLIVYGSSQGGYQALVAAGLDPRVSLICAGVPAGCDHTGMEADRISGWPKLVPVDASGKPDPAALQAARYYDAVNFAQRAKCREAVVTVGLIDTTCPPTSVYVAYNALPVPKKLHVDVHAGHTNTPGAVKFMQDAIHAHVLFMKQQ